MEWAQGRKQTEQMYAQTERGNSRASGMMDTQTDRHQPRCVQTWGLRPQPPQNYEGLASNSLIKYSSVVSGLSWLSAACVAARPCLR